MFQCQDCSAELPGARRDKIRCPGCNRRHRTKSALMRRRSKGLPERGVASKAILCAVCGKSFLAQRRTRLRCDRCITLKIGIRNDLLFERTCLWCGSKWKVERGDRRKSGLRYCSQDCRRGAAIESRTESRRRAREGTLNPKAGRPRVRPDGFSAAFSRSSLQARFFLKNPDRPKSCEACGEMRVVELAHKIPRRSAWRTVPKSSEVWVLCPTCHRCLDSGIETVESLKLLP